MDKIGEINKKLKSKEAKRRIKKEMEILQQKYDDIVMAYFRIQFIPSFCCYFDQYLGKVI